MKIVLNDGFLTDDTRDLVGTGGYFVRTGSNAKYATPDGAKIITPKEAIGLLNLQNPPKIVAITGTNGKTTTAFAIYETLLKMGYNAAVAGTSGAWINGQNVAPKGLTTAQFLQTLNLIKMATQQKCDFFIMEASSHAIAQNRIEGLEFALKIFTNLSQDHLDFHGSFENYAAVKSSFFADEGVKLINSDDPFIKYNPQNAAFYSLNQNTAGDQNENGNQNESSDQNAASLTATGASFSPNITAKISLNSEAASLASPLVGRFNLYNLLAAIGAIKLLTGAPLCQITEKMGEFKGASGRMQKISQKPLIIVDFAHTPDGMQKVLEAMAGVSVIAVFGAGGDRDRTKRPLMGEIAAKYAHTAIITSDNPRSEEPAAIINDILSGISETHRHKIIVEPDRTAAIKIAINLLISDSAKKDYAILILGKGDENYQEIKGVKHPFSDEAAAKQILKDLNAD